MGPRAEKVLFMVHEDGGNLGSESSLEHRDCCSDGAQGLLSEQRELQHLLIIIMFYINRQTGKVITYHL